MFTRQPCFPLNACLRAQIRPTHCTCWDVYVTPTVSVPYFLGGRWAWQSWDFFPVCINYLGPLWTKLGEGPEACFLLHLVNPTHDKLTCRAFFFSSCAFHRPVCYTLLNLPTSKIMLDLDHKIYFMYSVIPLHFTPPCITGWHVTTKDWKLHKCCQWVAG